MNTNHDLTDADLEAVAAGKNVPYTPPMPFLGGGMRLPSGPGLGLPMF